MKKEDIFIWLIAIPVAAAAYAWIFFSILWEALCGMFRSHKPKKL